MVELPIAGIILISLGIFFILLGIVKSDGGAEGKTKVAVGGFIGPIPFGFGSDKNMVYFTLGLAIAMFVIFSVLQKTLIVR